jgi:hypothetical protein
MVIYEGNYEGNYEGKILDQISMATTNADGNTRTERIDFLVETSTD